MRRSFYKALINLPVQARDTINRYKGESLGLGDFYFKKTQVSKKKNEERNMQQRNSWHCVGKVNRAEVEDLLLFLSCLGVKVKRKV